MRIQVIRYGLLAGEKDGIVFSTLDAPRAIDDFDITVIDLSVSSLWTTDTACDGKINAYRDLETIQQMVVNKKKSIVLYVLPQNIRYKYNIRYHTSSSVEYLPLKDVLPRIQKESIDRVIPEKTNMANIVYERTETRVLEHKFDADFYLDASNKMINSPKILTKSEKSEKPTTIEILPKVYVTTLAITKSNEDIKHFVTSLFDQHQQCDVPSWVKDVYFGDDIEQNTTIEQCERQIEEANHTISAAKARLEENAEIKSILYTNGEQLVSVIYKILEKLLQCDLSSFVDEKKEDFLIQRPKYTFIGEIKGVTSNVKSEHISQLDVHYQSYLDRLNESGKTENVKQILIMNPFRTKALDQREAINDTQIALAVRNKCLIIETYTLLRVYERFCAEQITAQQCEEVLASRIGLLNLSDFGETVEDLNIDKI